MRALIKKHWKKVVYPAIALPLMLVMLILLVLHSALVQNFALDKVLPILSQKLHREIKVDYFHLSLFGGKIVIKDALFANPEGFDFPHTGKLDSLEVKFRFLPLLKGQVIVDSIVIDKPCFFHERSTDHFDSVTGKKFGRWKPPKKRKKKKKDIDKILNIFFTRVRFNQILLNGVDYRLDFKYMPMHVYVPETHLQMQWNDEKKHYDISFTAPFVEFAIKNKVKVQTRVVGHHVIWHPKGFLVDDLDINVYNDKAKIKVTQVDIREFRKIHIDLRALVSADASVAKDIVNIPVEIAGHTDVVATMQLRYKDFNMRFKGVGRDVQGWKTRADDMAFEAFLNDERFVLENYDLNVCGGKVKGFGKVVWKGPDEGLMFMGQTYDVQTLPLFEMLDIPLNLSAEGTGAYRFDMKDLEPENLKVQGEVITEGKTIKGNLPYTAYSKYNVSLERVRLNEGVLHFKGSVATFDGNINYRADTIDSNVEVQGTDLGYLGRFLDRILPEILTDKVDLSDVNLSQTLKEGSYSGTFEVTGPMTQPIVIGNLKSENAVVSNFLLEDMDATMMMDWKTLEISPVKLRQGEKTMSGDVTIDLEAMRRGHRTLKRQIRGDGVYMSKMAKLLNKLPPMFAPLEFFRFHLGRFLRPVCQLCSGLGELEGKLTLETRTETPEGYLDVTLHEGALLGYQLESVKLKGQLDEAGLNIDDEMRLPLLGEVFIDSQIGFDDRFRMSVTIPPVCAQNIHAIRELGLPISFMADVNIFGEGSLSNPWIIMDMNITGFSYDGYDLGKVTAGGFYHQHYVVTNGSALDGKLIWSVWIDLQKPTRLSLNMDVKELPLERVIPLFSNLPEDEITGFITGRFTLQTALSDYEQSKGEFRVDSLQINWRNQHYNLTEPGVIFYKPDKVTLSGFKLQNPLLALQVGGEVYMDQDVNLHLKAKTNLNMFSDAVEAIDTLEGDGNLTVRIFGEANRPSLTIVAETNIREFILDALPDLNFSGGGRLSFQSHFSTHPYAAAIVEQVLKNAQVSCDRFGLNAAGMSFTASGYLPHDPAQEVFKVEHQLDLKKLEQLVPGIKWIEGALTSRLRIEGDLLHPKINGESDINIDIARTDFLPLAIQETKGKLTFQDRSIFIEKVSGKIGRGSIDISGEIKLRGWTPTLLDLKTNLNEVFLRYPDGVSSVFSARLQITGNSFSPLIDGRINFNKVRYTKNIQYQSILVETSSKLVFSREYDPVSEESPFNPKFDIKIYAPGTVQVRNNLANMDLEADLTLRGTLQQPLLFGHVEALKGTLIFKEHSFDLISGNIDFIDPFQINPSIDFSASTTIQEYKIKLFISGNLKSNLTVETESSPPLDPIDVFALLFFGKTMQEFSEQKDQTTQVTGMKLLSNYLSAQLENRARYIGVDTLEIDQSIETKATTITLGKHLTENLEILYSAEYPTEGDGQGIVIKYSLTENIQLVGERDKDGSYGGDIRLQFRFR